MKEMTTRTTPRLRNDPILVKTTVVVKYIYSILDDITSNFPDEEWNTVSKLRTAANDCIFYVAQGVGNNRSDAGEYEWNSARRNLFALQTMYIFATKQQFVEIEPDIIVQIDKMIAEIDSKIAFIATEDEKKQKQDLEPWLEKYRLWQTMQEK